MTEIRTPTEAGTSAARAFGLALVLPFVCGALWLGICKLGLVPGYLLPSPITVFEAGYRYIFAAPGTGPYAGRFVQDLTASLGRVLLGFTLAAALGLPLGICAGRLALVNRLVAGLIGGLRAVPGICWLPLALIWFGIGLKTTVFLVGLAAFFPIYQNACTGAQQVAPIYLQAGAMLGLSRLRAVFAIILPMAMPNIRTGLRLGLGIAWAYLVLGELTGVSEGLGAMIMDARMLGQTDLILAGILLIAAVGRLCDRLLVLLLRLASKSARRLA